MGWRWLLWTCVFGSENEGAVTDTRNDGWKSGDNWFAGAAPEHGSAVTEVDPERKVMWNGMATVLSVVCCHGSLKVGSTLPWII